MAGITELKETPGYIPNPIEQTGQEPSVQSQNSGDTPPPVSPQGAPQVSQVVPGEVLPDNAQTLTPDYSDTSAMANVVEAISGIFPKEEETTELPTAPDAMDLNIGIEPAPFAPPTVTTNDGPEGTPQTTPQRSIFMQMAPYQWGQLSGTNLEDSRPAATVAPVPTWEKLLNGGQAPQQTAPATPSFDVASAGTRAIQASAQPDKTPLSVAQAYMGYDERDPAQAKALSGFFSRAAGLDLDPSSTAWCAGFVNAVLGDAGMGGTGALNARSFLNYGKAVENPQVGDIVVFSRGDPDGWQGHVGFIAGVNKDGSLQVLGGNQSTAESGARGVTVNITTYGTDKVLGYRRPVPVGG